MNFYAYKSEKPLYLFVRYGTLWYSTMDAKNWMADSTGMQVQLEDDLRTGELKTVTMQKADQYAASFRQSLEDDREWHRERIAMQACRARSVSEGAPQLPPGRRKSRGGAANANSGASEPAPEPVPAKILAVKILERAVKAVSPGTLYRAIGLGTQAEFKAVLKLLIRHGRLKTVRIAGRLLVRKV